uniref:Nucleotide-diphospho-sugar transferase domain-containing protein n=1 Tax=viral metagenome TaxID=1070528 RepID=A0A6C0DF49_9ZZZZ
MLEPRPFNICMVMWYDSDVSIYGDMTKKINKSYCEKYNIHFIHCDEKRYDDRHPAWEKLLLILKHIENYDYIIWVDADAFFYMDSPNISEIIYKKPNVDLIFSGDKNVIMNTGIFIVKNTKYSIHFLNEWAYNNELYSSNPYPHWWENGVIIDIYNKNLLNIKENSVIIPYGILQDFDEKYKNKPYIYHLAGKNKQIRIQKCLKYYNKYNNIYKTNNMEMKTTDINQVFCIGPFNTGTNLLEKILSNSDSINTSKNEKIKIMNKERDEWIPNVNFKHCFSRDILNKYIHTPKTGIIILYKNVYNWLYSMKKEHYDIKLVNNKLFDTLVFCNYKFDNIIHLYNLYYTMYMDIIQQNSNVIFVDYYKLINKESSFEYLNQKLSPLGIKINNRETMMKQLNKPAKTHGKCIQNSNVALQNYLLNQELVKTFVIKNTKLIHTIDTKIIEYFENEET